MYYLAATATVRCISVREYLERQLTGKSKEDGYSAETVIIIGALAFLAIGVTGVIAYKVMNKVNSINLDSTPAQP
jgi:hypothetical protein